MPAWNGTLNDAQIWQTVTFLSNFEKLPPAARKVLEPAAAPVEAAQ
jgi:mono/diheme cytochrome c family protein